MAERASRKMRIGKVISDKMDKTVVVAVEDFVSHKLYAKSIKRTTKYKAHDESNQCKVGDKVRIIETRPISKEKNWRVGEVLEKSQEVN